MTTMMTRSEIDRLERLEAGSADIKKNLGEIEASLAEISRLLWKKQMGEIRARLAMISKAIRDSPTENYLTAETQNEVITPATPPATVAMGDSMQQGSSAALLQASVGPVKDLTSVVGPPPHPMMQPQLVSGNMQLFSEEQQRSQELEACTASFGSRRVLGNVKNSILISFATKSSNAGHTTSKLHDIELGAKLGRPSFRKKQAGLFFTPDFGGVFPVAKQVSHRHGLKYGITKLGPLLLYDLVIVTARHTNRISPNPVFLTSEASSVGGFYAINRCGRLLLAKVNASNIVPFGSGKLKNLGLVKWTGQAVDKAMWFNKAIFLAQFPYFNLVVKVFSNGDEIVMKQDEYNKREPRAIKVFKEGNGIRVHICELVCY